MVVATVQNLSLCEDEEEASRHVRHKQGTRYRSGRSEPGAGAVPCTGQSARTHAGCVRAGALARAHDAVMGPGGFAGTSWG